MKHIQIDIRPLLAAKKCCIDSSTLIYLYKADCLEDFIKSLNFLIPESIIEELATDKDMIPDILKASSTIHIIPKANIKITESNENKVSRMDLECINLAWKEYIPLFSEDKEIIKIAQSKNIPYYNALIAICFMNIERIYSKEKAITKLFRLASIAWYDNAVFNAVFKLLDNSFH